MLLSASLKGLVILSPALAWGLDWPVFCLLLSGLVKEEQAAWVHPTV